MMLPSRPLKLIHLEWNCLKAGVKGELICTEMQLVFPSGLWPNYRKTGEYDCSGVQEKKKCINLRRLWPSNIKRHV